MAWAPVAYIYIYENISKRIIKLVLAVCSQINDDIQTWFDKKYLLFKCGIKTKTHFDTMACLFWFSLVRFNLEPFQPNCLVGCKVPTDLLKISVKEIMQIGFYHIIIYYSALQVLTDKYLPEAAAFSMEYMYHIANVDTFIDAMYISVIQHR